MQPIFQIEPKTNHISDLEQILTSREFELCYLLIRRELTHSDIGKTMHISRGTVSKHVSNIYHKIGVSNRSDFLKNTFQIKI